MVTFTEEILDGKLHFLCKDLYWMRMFPFEWMVITAAKNHLKKSQLTLS